MPSARSASQTFEASPGTAAKAGASSSHELANSSSESPSRLKLTIRICTATSSVRAGGPRGDDDVPPGCVGEDLMRISLPCSDGGGVRQHHPPRDCSMNTARGFVDAAVSHHEG